MVNDDHWKIATTKEDLERKSLETLEWLIDRATTGQITTGELRIALQTVFNLTSGLVGQHVYEVIEMAKPDQVQATVLRRVFTRNDSPRIFVVSWEIGADFFHVTGQSLLGDKRMATQKYACPDSRTALHRLTHICNGLANDHGLEEVV